MKIALIHDAELPVKGYGGTERVIWWLSKGLAEFGHEVVLVCREGSHCDWAEVVPHDFSSGRTPQPNCDVAHLFYTPSPPPACPYVVTIEGNGKAEERFLANTIFVSRNHAERHNAQCYVYNGIDPDEYEFRSQKDDYLVFLGKASWSVKNVKGAQKIAKECKRPLHVLGGSKWLLNGWNQIHWKGMIGGKQKAQEIAGASALIFPVLWDEPFGIANVEALVSGTPVIASPFGSLPEIVTEETGRICHNYEEFVQAVNEIGRWDADACRQRALDLFHYRQMTESYLGYYEKAIDGEPLNPTEPHTLTVPKANYSLHTITSR